MAKQANKVEGQYVRKETFWLVTLLALAVGFFGGVVFAVFQSDSGAVPGQSQVGTPQPQTAAPDRSNMIAALEKETRENPGSLDAWIALGNSYFDTNQYEKSIAAYRKALDIKPDNPNIWTDMGIMYRRSGNPQEAIKCFDKAIEVDPRHEIARMNKGIVLLHDLNDADGAIKAWEELIEINPVAMAPTGRSVDEMVQQLKARGPQAEKGPAQ